MQRLADEWLKTRGMRHHPTVHRYEITPNGFELGDAVAVAP